MLKYIFILFLLLSTHESSLLQCGEEKIDHCLSCNEEEDKNSCKQCEDKYFPVVSIYHVFLVIMNKAVVEENAT